MKPPRRDAGAQRQADEFFLRLFSSHQRRATFRQIR